VKSTRDPQASWPFDPNPGSELDRVLRACAEDRHPVVGPAAKLLTYAGPHISVLTGGWRRETIDGETREWYQPPLDGHAIRGDYIFWRRPKNQKPIQLRLSKQLAPWLREWLDRTGPGGPEERPFSTRRYEQLFARVGDRIGIQVNPLRFRHTFGVLLYHVHKLTAPDVARLMGCSTETLATYIVRPPWVISEDLVRSGW
jgi:integrase